LENRWHKIRLGLCNTYLIEGSRGAVLVDAGPKHCEKFLFRYLARQGIAPTHIRLVIVTHAHFDHVGGLKAIREVCRCPVAIHPVEGDLVRCGRVVFPPGINWFGKTASSLGRAFGGHLFQFAATDPDILISEEMSLEDFGVSGKIIPTPGHTSGSLSVLLSDGVIFVGDTAANYLPGRLGPILPPFAEDVRQLLESWNAILLGGARLICPGHGRPFHAELLRQEMKRFMRPCVPKPHRRDRL
jgi:hydroxyacylglutathione hydrolase